MEVEHDSWAVKFARPRQRLSRDKPPQKWIEGATPDLSGRIRRSAWFTIRLLALLLAIVAILGGGEGG
jgi:hypothetical protein